MTTFPLKSFRVGARVLAILIVANACSGSKDSTAPPADPHVAAAGTYYMVTFNNGPLPQTVFTNAAGRVEVSGGNLVLRGDRSFTETRILRTVFNSGATPETTPLVDNGTFAIVGTQITFTLPASGTAPAFSYTGAISGDVLSYTFEGDAFTYQR